MRWAALALAAVAFTGCETSAERSAQLEREAKSHAPLAAQQGLKITHRSTTVVVSRTAIVTGAEGSAAVVTLVNRTRRPVREVPLAIAVRDARGATVYTNTGPGVARSLVSAPFVPAHGRLVWVDDQVRSSGGPPATVSAIAGQSPPAPGQLPRITTRRVQLGEDPSEPSLTGTVTNSSGVTQRELAVYAVARRAGRIVAAGRAILAQLEAHASAQFQIFFDGDPRGARLEVKAPPSSFE